MKTILRLSIVALLFTICFGSRASAQTITGGGVVFNAAVVEPAQPSQQQMAQYGASFTINAAMAAGKANGTMVLDFATGNYSGFVQNITVSAPGTNGAQTATVTSVGWLTITATGAKTALSCAAVYQIHNGASRAMSLTFYNYPTGTFFSQGTFNLISGGVAAVN